MTDGESQEKKSVPYFHGQEITYDPESERYNHPLLGDLTAVHLEMNTENISTAVKILTYLEKEKGAQPKIKENEDKTDREFGWELHEVETSTIYDGVLFTFHEHKASKPTEKHYMQLGFRLVMEDPRYRNGTIIIEGQRTRIRNLEKETGTESQLEKVYNEVMAGAGLKPKA